MGHEPTPPGPRDLGVGKLVLRAQVQIFWGQWPAIAESSEEQCGVRLEPELRSP